MPLERDCSSGSEVLSHFEQAWICWSFLLVQTSLQTWRGYRGQPWLWSRCKPPQG